MKKMIFVLVAMAICAMPALANEVKVADRIKDIVLNVTLTPTIQKNFNFENQNLDKANDYIKTDPNTLDLLKYFHKVFAEEMTKASMAKTTQEQNSIINGALNYLESNAGKVLEDKGQRHRYFIMLNTTLQNRGFGENIAMRKKSV